MTQTPPPSSSDTAQDPTQRNPALPKVHALNAALGGWVSYIILMILLVPTSLLLPTDSSVLLTLLGIGTAISTLFWLAAIALGIRHLLAHKDKAKSWGGITISLASLTLFGSVFYVVWSMGATAL